jgi:hypothetical protein
LAFISIVGTGRFRRRTATPSCGGAAQNGDLLGSGTDTDIIAKARQDIGAHVSRHSAAVTEGFLGQALLSDSPHVFYRPPDKAQAEIDTIREAVRKDPDEQQNELLKTALYTAVEADTNAKFERQASDHGAQLDGARRLDEIRKLRRNDPDSYEKNAAMQAEELRFISAASRGGASPPEPTNQPDNQPAEGK